MTQSIRETSRPRLKSVTFLAEPATLQELDAMAASVHTNRSEMLRRIMLLGMEGARQELRLSSPPGYGEPNDYGLAATAAP